MKACQKIISIGQRVPTALLISVLLSSPRGGDVSALGSAPASSVSTGERSCLADGISNGALAEFIPHPLDSRIVLAALHSTTAAERSESSTSSTAVAPTRCNVPSPAPTATTRTRCSASSVTEARQAEGCESAAAPPPVPQCRPHLDGRRTSRLVRSSPPRISRPLSLARWRTE
jgi:hypothetical protein